MRKGCVWERERESACTHKRKPETTQGYCRPHHACSRGKKKQPLFKLILFVSSFFYAIISLGFQFNPALSLTLWDNFEGKSGRSLQYQRKPMELVFYFCCFIHVVDLCNYSCPYRNSGPSLFNSIQFDLVPSKTSTRALTIILKYSSKYICKAHSSLHCHFPSTSLRHLLVLLTRSCLIWRSFRVKQRFLA